MHFLWISTQSMKDALEQMIVLESRDLRDDVVKYGKGVEEEKKVNEDINL